MKVLTICLLILCNPVKSTQLNVYYISTFTQLVQSINSIHLYALQGQDYRIDCVKQHTDLNHCNMIEKKVLFIFDFEWDEGKFTLRRFHVLVSFDKRVISAFVCFICLFMRVIKKGLHKIFPINYIQYWTKNVATTLMKAGHFSLYE